LYVKAVLEMIDLIYCAGGNEKLSQIAHEENWKLGKRSDASLQCYPPIFIDIDYKKPNFEKHLEVIAKYNPKYATVPDLSEREVSTDDINRAMKQYDAIQEYCDIPLIVPKLPGQIAMLPADVAIGYSVPSSYGGAQYPLWELAGRRVHLLGGSPKKQFQAFMYLNNIAEVMSLDGNYAQKMATRYGEYWEKHQWIKHTGVKFKEKDVYFECWRWSCRNILHEWQKFNTSSQVDKIVYTEDT
jgi:hypothetical protein